MRLLTLNCHSLLEYDTKKQIKEIVDFVVRESITIVALQEVSQLVANKNLEQASLAESGFVMPAETDIPVKEGNFAYLLAQAFKKVKLSFSWTWTATHIGYDKLDEGIALLTLKPLSDVHAPVIAASSEYDQYTDYRRRKLLFGKVGDEKGSVVATGHLDGWQKDIFYAEWDQVLENLAEFADSKAAVYLLGDFNVDAEKDETNYAHICRKFIDTYEVALSRGDGMTVRGSIDGWEDSDVARRIDYILTTDSKEVAYSRVCFDGQETQRISDHAGIVVEMATPVTVQVTANSKSATA